MWKKFLKSKSEDEPPQQAFENTQPQPFYKNLEMKHIQVQYTVHFQETLYQIWRMRTISSKSLRTKMMIFSGTE